MSFFACKHPAAYLGVQKRETVEPSKQFPDEYEEVTSHLYCMKCGEHLDHIGYSRLNAKTQAEEDARHAAHEQRREAWRKEDEAWNEWWAPRRAALYASRKDPA